MIRRDLYLRIWKELSQDKSMVFLSGPRQSGKTTLADMIGSHYVNRLYFNWDIEANRKKLITNPTFFESLKRIDSSAPLIVLDEIHKYPRWKKYLKGVHDQFSKRYQFLILGSGRLDEYQKGGDSLVGRYFLFRLWPFTLAELSNRRFSWKEFSRDPLKIEPGNQTAQKIWKRLANVSGFPEPYRSGKRMVYRRWSNAYSRQLIREDIQSMTDIKHIDFLEVLFSLLPTRIGNPLSLASLCRDLEVSFKSIKNWLDVFERLYLVFRISPWSKRVSRALRKEKKLYLYDYAGISSQESKFENMVAVELLRAVSNWNDLGYGDFGLHYIRNKEKEEVDFLITSENKPLLLVEAKSTDTNVAKSLLKFQSIFNIPAIQLVLQPGIYRLLSNGMNPVLITSASSWIATLP